MRCSSPGCGETAQYVVTDPEPDASTENLVLLLGERCVKTARESALDVRRIPKRRK